jgi:hypothetical protein
VHYLTGRTVGTKSSGFSALTKDIIVHVRPDEGFECNGRIYKSLSRAVTEATGTRWNGFAFYGLGHRPGVKHGEQE